MLRKLMKHELRATGRIMLPLFLLLLVTAVGANISTRSLLETDNNILNTLGVLIMMAFAIAIAAVCIMSCVLMVYRFYKNILQDEGYVTMTLPVSVHQQLISKLLVSMLWFVLSMLVVALASFILAYQVGIVKEMLNVLRAVVTELFDSGYTFDAVLFFLEMFVLVFFSAASACLHFYLALAIGHSFSSKKLLWSIVFYFVIQLAMNTLGSFVMFSLQNLSFLDIFKTDLFTGMDSISIAHTAICALIGVSAVGVMLFYFPTVYFLKNRLNLE